MWFKQAVMYKKAALADLLAAPMADLADACAPIWCDADEVDGVLAASIAQVPHCHLLYTLDTQGVQLSSNVHRARIDRSLRGQRLDNRPYTGNLPYRGFLLSSVYVSNVTRKHCITAVQAVTDATGLLGFVAADFNLDDIPSLSTPEEPQSRWTQYRGDPAIRTTVFMQERMKSPLDERMPEVIDSIDTLMGGHGVYHVILHFSSSRAIFWVYDDPYRYRFHGVDDILDPEIWLAYPAQPYPAQAIVAKEKIRAVLDQFRSLREDDANIYLRSASLNVMNGIIGLTFSCDGSHYITVDEFLDKEHPFWV